MNANREQESVEPGYLIIAGTEKAGTTSLFRYLADSGMFHLSKKKETDFFRQPGPLSESDYRQQFRRIPGGRCYLEASPGYLSDSHIAAANLTATLSAFSLLFCLRDPLMRLLSSFLFHKSRLLIPRHLSIDSYFDDCLRFEAGEKPRGDIPEWCLRVPDCGRYAKHLRDFAPCHENICRVVYFEELLSDPATLMRELFANIGLGAWPGESHYRFERANATAGHRSDGLQKLALRVNNSLERVWRRSPALKQALLGLYGVLNGAEKERVSISPALRQRIFSYYEADLTELRQMPFIDAVRIDGWLSEMAQAKR